MSKDPDPRLNAMPDKTRLERSLRSLVAALRELLEAAGPEASPFLRDWPQELTPRPIVPHPLPVVSALQGLSRFAAPEDARFGRSRRGAGRRSRLAADLYERRFRRAILKNYGWSEWIGQRGAFESDAIACGVLLLGPETEYPAHSHEAEELYLPLAGHAWWRMAKSDWRLRPPGQWIHHPSWTTHAMRTAARTPARGLCLARRRPHGEVAPNLGSTGSVTDVSRSQPSFSSTICSMATSALLA